MEAEDIKGINGDAADTEVYAAETPEEYSEEYAIHEHYMTEALKEAKAAADSGEVPIGCVIVYDNKIIGRGHNLRNSKKNPLCHAEISAINQAAEFIGDWRLEDCTLYVTVEPCPMCAGAIVQARIPYVVFGTRNVKAGCAGSILNILNEPRFNHQVQVTEGILRENCAEPMGQFFKRFRKSKNQENKEAHTSQETAVLPDCQGHGCGDGICAADGQTAPDIKKDMENTAE